MTNEFVWSIKNGELDPVRELVEKQKIDVNRAIEETGRYPLHYAADYGQRDVMAYLIDRGADVNALDKHGISVLLAAIWEGHTACVQLLLDHGATPVGRTPDGKPYNEAAETPEIQQLLSQAVASSMS